MESFSARIKYFISIIFFAGIIFSPDIHAQHFAHAGGGGARFSGGGSFHQPSFNSGGAGYHAPAYNAGGGAFRSAPVNNNRSSFHPSTFNNGAGVRYGGNRNDGAGNHQPTTNGGSRNSGRPTFGRRSRNTGKAFNVPNNENAFHNDNGSGQSNGTSHLYQNHPYHPYHWGQNWHPLGYFSNDISDDASMLDVNGDPYYYDNGVYYSQSLSGFTAVAPPIGAVVTYLPAGYETVPVGDINYYYYGGAFYADYDGSYQVVPAPIGAVVSEIPEGGAQQTINGMNFVFYNNTYFEPISYGGQDAYEVVQPN